MLQNNFLGVFADGLVKRMRETEPPQKIDKEKNRRTGLFIWRTAVLIKMKYESHTLGPLGRFHQNKISLGCKSGKKKKSNQSSLKDSSHKQVRPIRHNVTASSSGGTAARCVAVMPPSKLTVVIAAIQGHDNAQHKAKTWKLRDIRMCRNLFLKRTSRSKQHSSSNEAFSLNNSSEIRIDICVYCNFRREKRRVIKIWIQISQ